MCGCVSNETPISMSQEPLLSYLRHRLRRVRADTRTHMIFTLFEIKNPAARTQCAISTVIPFSPVRVLYATTYCFRA